MRDLLISILIASSGFFLISCGLPQNGNDMVSNLPLIKSSTSTRVSPSQDEWEIRWNGTPNTDFYVTYGSIVEQNNVESESSVSWDQGKLPMSLKFFLEPGKTTLTATINLAEDGEVGIQLYKNGVLCDEASQLGSQPSIRVTCFSRTE